MSYIFCFLFVFFSGGLQAQTASPTESSLSAIDRLNWDRFHPAISEKYLRGNFLIYDCVGGYFVCVEEKNFQYCQQKREETLLLETERLPCAPFREYPTYTLCVHKQYELMHKAKPYSFCFHSNTR